MLSLKLLIETFPEPRFVFFSRHAVTLLPAQRKIMTGGRDRGLCCQGTHLYLLLKWVVEMTVSACASIWFYYTPRHLNCPIFVQPF